MATEKIDAIPLQEPSSWWRLWQALKGTNFRQLTIADVDLRNKWVLITGGNSGIGKEAALQFAKWGANIVLGCRQPPPHETHPDHAVQDLSSAAHAAGHSTTRVEWWEVDMANLASVEALGKRWLETGRPLDILANNAGMPGKLGEAQYTRDGFEIVHQVNFLSHVLLTMVLLPALVEAPAPRIICTTSCMQYFGVFDLNNANSGKISYPNNKLYFQTWLTELQSRMLQRNKYRHIVVHGVHPGYVKTNIWNSPKESASMSWMEWVLVKLLKHVGIDSQQGSLAITHAIVASEACRDRCSTMEKGCRCGGKYFNRIWEEEPMPHTKHPICRREVWEFVNEELKLQEKGLLYVLDG